MTKPQWAERYEDLRRRAETAQREYTRTVSEMAQVLSVDRCRVSWRGGSCTLDYGHTADCVDRKENYPDGWEFR